MDITGMVALGEENQGILEGWSKSEKFDLFHCLKTKGSHNLKVIHQYIPSKTPDQIEQAINFYKKKAFINPNHKTKKGKKFKVDGNSKSTLPIAQWAKLLTDNFEYDYLQTETAAALRLIAEFDAIPSAICTENFDFKKAYLTLANAIEGKSLEEDRHFTLLLNKCILDTALTCKQFIRLQTLRQIINNIDLSVKAKPFPKPTSNQELMTVTHLVLQRNYNPLNISEEFLKAE